MDNKVVYNLFASQKRDWVAADKQKVKEKKQQYKRKPVGVVAQQNRINGIRRKKQQAKFISTTPIKPNKPVPRANDQPSIKRKLEDMSKKVVQPVWKFYGKKHGARIPRRKGDLHEYEDA